MDQVKDVESDPLADAVANISIRTSPKNCQRGPKAADTENTSYISHDDGRQPKDNRAGNQFETLDPESDTSEDEVDNMGEIPDEYDFSHKRKGTALIFSFGHYTSKEPPPERKGADFEALNFKNLLECLDFKVFIHLNKTTKEVKEVIRLAALEDHSDADCFCCIVMSHGDQCVDFRNKDKVEIHDAIYTTDSHVVMDDVILPFREDKCQSLAGKPKLFFIQACRGHLTSVKVPIVEIIGQREQEESIGSDVKNMDGAMPIQQITSQIVDSPKHEGIVPEHDYDMSSHDLFSSGYGHDISDNSCDSSVKCSDGSCEQNNGLAVDSEDTEGEAGSDDLITKLGSSTETEDETDWKLWSNGKKPWKPIPYKCLKHPCYRDFLVVHCTIPGHAAFRNAGRSWFLLELFCELKKSCSDLELMEMLERVNLKVAYGYCFTDDEVTKGQMPWIMSALPRQVYLHPSEKQKERLDNLKWESIFGSFKV